MRENVKVWGWPGGRMGGTPCSVGWGWRFVHSRRGVQGGPRASLGEDGVRGGEVLPRCSGVLPRHPATASAVGGMCVQGPTIVGSAASIGPPPEVGEEVFGSGSAMIENFDEGAACGNSPSTFSFTVGWGVRTQRDTPSLHERGVYSSSTDG